MYKNLRFDVKKLLNSSNFLVIPVLGAVSYLPSKFQSRRVSYTRVEVLFSFNFTKVRRWFYTTKDDKQIKILDKWEN